jgi:hypothetical protein
MKLADVMSALRLEAYAEVAFVLAAAAFLTVLVTTFMRRNREPFEHARRLPLAADGGAAREDRDE